MMVNRAACEDCGTRVDYLSRDGPLYCECGEEMETIGKVGCVRGLTEGQTPNGDLEELVEQWRNAAVTSPVESDRVVDDLRADELEDTIVTEES